MDLQNEIDKYMEEKENEVKERDYFYISEIGKSKKELYENLKNPKPFTNDARVQRILQNGNSVHERYMKYFAEMGILVCSEIDVSKNDLVHGRCDAIISDKERNYVVEIKSASQWTFNKLTKPTKPHELQLQFYMYYLNIDKGIILYECKDNQTIKCFYLDLDKKLVEDKLNELKEIKEVIKSGDEIVEEKPTIETLNYIG